MDSPKKILKSIEKWAKNQENVRAVILLGSQARRGDTDRLSDIDLHLIVENPNDFTEQDNWFEDFGPVWLSVFKRDNENVNLKIIYEGGVLVEFVISPKSAIEKMDSSLPPHYEPGYAVLDDKDKLTKILPKASGTARPPERPLEEDFQNTLSDFWLNAYHVAKYLWRRDLWRAKHHDWLMKGNLLEMMGWHSLLISEQQSFTTYQGKGLQGWIAPETFTSLMTVFGRFYPADSWRALEDTIKIFTKLSNELAEFLNADPRLDLRNKFMPLIKDLQNNPPE
jgi:aminoglycoside 6-adenylyltransferase